MTEKNSSKAKRLCYVLKSYSEDTNSIVKLARILNYVPDELQKDMKAVISYITELEGRIKEE